MNQDMDKPHGSNIRFVKAATERNVLCDFVRVKCKRQAKLSYGVRGPGSTQGCLGGDQKGTQGLCWGAGKVPVLDLVAMTPMGSLWEVHSWFAPFPYTYESNTQVSQQRIPHMLGQARASEGGGGGPPGSCIATSRYNVHSRTAWNRRCCVVTKENQHPWMGCVNGPMYRVWRPGIRASLRRGLVC